MPIIETHQLTRRFFSTTGFSSTTALSDVNLSIEPGTVNVLIGANGAGKTTLLKVLMNLIPPSTGSATVMGADSRRLGPKQFARIGYASENLKHPEGLTVQGLLDTWRPLYPQWDSTLEKRLLKDFDLPPNRKLSQLSRGMLMKASLLSILPYRPELIVLDEPFSGLDPLVRDQVVQGLLELVSDEGCTVLVSSHEIAEVETLADNLIWLDRSELKLSEAADSLRARFRKVESDNPALTAPDHAWSVTQEGGRTRYIDTAFDTAFLPTGTTAEPMPLRDIFVELLRQSK